MSGQSDKETGLVDAGFTFVIRVIGAGLTFPLQLLLARLMPVEAYGGVVTLWTWLLAIGSFAALGFADSSVRFLPRYHARGREEHMRRFWRFGLRAVLVASGVLLLAALALAYFTGLDNDRGLIAFYVALGLPFLAIEYYLEGVARSFGWYRLTTVPVYLIRPVLIGGSCILLWAFAITLTLEVVGLVFIASMAAVSCALAVIMVHRLAGTRAGSTRTPRQERLWLKASLPLLFVAGLEDLMIYCDVLLLSLLLPPEKVAIYFAASRALALAEFVYYAIYFVSGRRFSLALASSDKEQLQRSIRDAARTTFWLTLVSVAATLVAGPLLLSLFGRAFVEGYTVMLILGAGLVMRSFAGQAGEFLVVAGLQKENLIISAGILAFNAVLAAILIPTFGIEGAALATALSMTARAAALILIIQRKTGLRTTAFAIM